MRSALLLLLGLAGVFSACRSSSDAPTGAGGPAPDGGTAGGGGPSSDPGGGGRGGSGSDGGRPGPDTDGGTTGDAGKQTGGTSDGGCPGIFCDDFERATAGNAPKPPWTVDVSRAQDGAVIVDATMNHTPNGAKALKVSVVANPKPADAVWAFAQLAGAPALPLATMYGRMWVRFDQLASNGTDYFHVNNIQASGLLADGATTATDTLGMYYYEGINTQIGYTTNRKDGSSGLDNAYSPNGGSPPYTTPAVNTWLCYEWMFGQPDLLQVWLDRKQVISVDKTELKAASQADWPAPVQFTNLEIGWAQWWNSTVPTNMWVDDFVIGESRIGCE